MPSIKFLKNVDLFSTPVQTFTTSRDKKSNNKSFSEDHGSILGGILSVVCFVCTISYLASMFFSMINGHLDNFNSRTKGNSFDSSTNLEYMSNSSFLPSIEVAKLNS